MGHRRGVDDNIRSGAVDDCLQFGLLPRAHDFGFRPTTTIEEGLQRFVEWYREYNGVRRVAWA